MIIKDESEKLPRCLKSAKEVVNEIIILDTGSTDNSIQVAKEFGAKVYSFEWCNDFSVARNEALKYVTGDWVLVLDADEVLTPEIVPQIQKAIANPNTLVINLVRQEVGASQSPYSLVSRLFRYHAMIDDSVTQLLEKESHWQIVNLTTVAILHDGYQSDAIASLNKLAKAQSAMESFISENPNDPYVCSKLGGLYVQKGETEKGIDLFKRGLQSNKIDLPTLYELHYHLGNAYARLNKPNEAVKEYQAAIAQPILPQLKLGAYNNLGSLLQTFGEYELAQKVFKEVLTIDPNFALGYYNFGMTLKGLGKLEEAIAAYEKSLNLNPNYAPVYQNLGVIFFRLGKIPESLEAFQKAIALFQTQNPKEAQRLQKVLQEIGLNL
ncbi:MAG: tetratricopeptide repeat protein [Chroococcales cyanobacterium]